MLLGCLHSPPCFSGMTCPPALSGMIALHGGDAHPRPGAGSRMCSFYQKRKGRQGLTSTPVVPPSGGVTIQPAPHGYPQCSQRSSCQLLGYFSPASLLPRLEVGGGCRQLRPLGAGPLSLQLYHPLRAKSVLSSEVPTLSSARSGER